MLKGMKCSPETIIKMKEAAKNRKPQSAESRKRHGEAMHRRLQNKENHPMWGRHHTEEAKAKISAGHKGKYTGINSTWFGKKFSPEHREKLRFAHLGLKQTEETKRKRRESYHGEKVYQWNGGIGHHSEGYIFQAVKDHPFRDRRGYILQHRLVIESCLGRYLKKSEQCHHLNGVRSDNRPENLMAFTSRGTHIRFERGFAIRPEEIVFDGRSFH
jgi:hypothetical protein